MPPAPIDVRDRMGQGFTGWRPIGPDTVIGIAVHHSVSGGLFFTAAQMTVDDELNHLLMIDAYHVSKGWGGFAYHLAAFPSGRYYLCGSLNGARAHVYKRNHDLVGVVLIGDFTAAAPPRAQRQAAGRCLAYIGAVYPGRPVKGHRDWAGPG